MGCRNIAVGNNGESPRPQLHPGSAEIGRILVGQGWLIPNQARRRTRDRGRSFEGLGGYPIMATAGMGARLSLQNKPRRPGFVLMAQLLPTSTSGKQNATTTFKDWELYTRRLANRSNWSTTGALVLRARRTDKPLFHKKNSPY
jgi:hypothetical protein